MFISAPLDVEGKKQKERQYLSNREKTDSERKPAGLRGFPHQAKPLKL